MPLDPNPTDTPEPSPSDVQPGLLVVLSGASGSGKSTLVARLLERPDLGLPIRASVSATTRAPRPGEAHGINYYFVNSEEFRLGVEKGHFLEWAVVHGHLYGTPLGPINSNLARGTSVILVIDVQGALEVRRKVPDALLVFVHAPSPELEVLEGRLRARGTDSEATIQTRLANARREVALADRYDAHVINDDLDRAVDELAAILNRHRRGG